ncbi:MAG: hypothetical protein FWB80_09130 [Defluviitaleaceae bacterium]|nr:hypothetical protein [Defluviitaleaceae bacterium]
MLCFVLEVVLFVGVIAFVIITRGDPNIYAEDIQHFLVMVFMLFLLPSLLGMYTYFLVFWEGDGMENINAINTKNTNVYRTLLVVAFVGIIAPFAVTSGDFFAENARESIYLAIYLISWGLHVFVALLMWLWASITYESIGEALGYLVMCILILVTIGLAIYFFATGGVVIVG